MRLKTAIDGLRRLGSTPLRMLFGQRIVFATLSVVVALLPAVPAIAIDTTRPAQVRLIVKDDEGQALSGARIWMAAQTPGWLQEPQDALELKTDAAAGVFVKRQRPDAATRITWREAVQVELAGYLPARVWYTLFPAPRRNIRSLWRPSARLGFASAGRTASRCRGSSWRFLT